MLRNFLGDNTFKNKELKNLYYLLHGNGPMIIADIIDETAIKKTTLVRMLNELIKKNYIKEDGFGESNVGRPPILYNIVPTSAYIVGVHISRMKTNVTLLDLHYQLLDKEDFTMTPKHTSKIVIDKINATIEYFLHKHHIHLDDILGIGLASIGPLDRDKGVILEPGAFLSGDWNHVPIVKMIQEHLPLPVAFEKGANAAAIAEHHSFEGLYNNVLYFISGGWGMDCGVISEDMILQERSSDGNGYGHMVIDLDGRLCSCGSRGCLSAYTSFESIFGELKNVSNLSSEINYENFHKSNLVDIMNYFKKNKDTHKKILQSTRYLGVGLSNLIHIFQPQVVILSGPFIYQMEHYYEQVIVESQKQLLIKNDITFTKGNLQENAAAIGAGILLFNSFFQ